jgi:hypothetical protein
MLMYGNKGLRKSNLGNRYLRTPVTNCGAVRFGIYAPIPLS